MTTDAPTATNPTTTDTDTRRGEKRADAGDMASSRGNGDDSPGPVPEDEIRYAVGRRGPTYLSRRTMVVLAPHGPDAMLCGPEIVIPAHEVANLKRERDALQASLHELLTGPTLAFSEATAERMIQDTLREARGET